MCVCVCVCVGGGVVKYISQLDSVIVIANVCTYATSHKVGTIL